MEVWKIIFLSKWVICRFHVNLPGGKNLKIITFRETQPFPLKVVWSEWRAAPEGSPIHAILLMGPEIPRPTTVWMYFLPYEIHGILYISTGERRISDKSPVVVLESF